MSDMEDKKDDSPPTSGFFYSNEFNYIYKNLSTFILTYNDKLDSNYDYQVADSISSTGNPKTFYTNVNLVGKNGALLNISDSNKSLEELAYNNGDIIYLEKSIYEYSDKTNFSIGESIISVALNTLPIVNFKNISNGSDNSLYNYSHAIVYENNIIYSVLNLVGEQSWTYFDSIKHFHNSTTKTDMLMGGYIEQVNDKVNRFSTVIGDIIDGVNYNSSYSDYKKNESLGAQNMLSVCTFIIKNISGYNSTLFSYNNYVKFNIKNISILNNRLSNIKFIAVCKCTSSGNVNNYNSVISSEWDVSILKVLN